MPPRSGASPVSSPRHRGPLVVVVSALGGVTDLLLDGALRSARRRCRRGRRRGRRDPAKRHRALILRAGPVGPRAPPPARPGRRRGPRVRGPDARRSRRCARCRRSSAIGSSRAASGSPARWSAAAIAEPRPPHALAWTRPRLRRRPTAATAARRRTWRRRGRGRAACSAPLLRRGLDAGRARASSAQGPDGTLTTLGPRRLRSHGDAARPLPRRAPRRAVEGRAGDPHGGPAHRARRAPDPAAPPSRGRRGRLLRRQGAAPARADSALRRAASCSTCARSSIPTRPGTEVSARRTLAGYPVKALATIAGQALVTVAGKGMLGVPGIAARAFGAVHARGALGLDDLPGLVRELDRLHAGGERGAAGGGGDASGRSARSCTRGSSTTVAARDGLAVIAVVGEGMAGTPGIAARVFTALAEGRRQRDRRSRRAPRSATSRSWWSGAGGARRRAASTRPSSSRRSAAAARPRRRARDVVLLGFGRVGRALADQLAAAERPRPVARRRPARPLGLRLRPAGPLAPAAAAPGAKARTRARCSRPSAAAAPTRRAALADIGATRSRGRCSWT